jgi:hypothetical protein
MFKEGIGFNRRGTGTAGVRRRGGAGAAGSMRCSGTGADNVGRSAADADDIPARLPCGMREKGGMCGMPEKDRAGVM